MKSGPLYSCQHYTQRSREHPARRPRALYTVPGPRPDGLGQETELHLRPRPRVLGGRRGGRVRGLEGAPGASEQAEMRGDPEPSLQ